MSPGRTARAHAGVPIAHGRPCGERAARSRLPRPAAHASGGRQEHGPSGRASRRSGGAPSSGNRSCSSYRNASGRSGTLSMSCAQVVDERRAAAAPIGSCARSSAGRRRPGRSISRCRAASLQHRHVGIAEAVDRLLAVADDEDRRLERARCARPAPSPHDCDEQRHQLPLRAAGVLELVHQHVVIARFEPVAALRELLHLAAAARASAAARRRSRARRARRACGDTRLSAIAVHPPARRARRAR